MYDRVPWSIFVSEPEDAVWLFIYFIGVVVVVVVVVVVAAGSRGSANNIDKCIYIHIRFASSSRVTASRSQSSLPVPVPVPGRMFANHVLFKLNVLLLSSRHFGYPKPRRHSNMYI